MRNIVKGPEPATLREYRLTKFANYDDYKYKDTLRERLVAEQRGICCYCMGKIASDRESMKVEHWRPQSGTAYGELQLVYSNLLGACLGGDGQRDADRHCDTAKGNMVLSLNPANPDHNVQGQVHYDLVGTITSPNATFNDELNRVLNLNTAHLKNSRIGQLRAFQGLLKRRGALSKQQLTKISEKWAGLSHSNALEPYCGVVVYWAQKKLARLK